MNKRQKYSIAAVIARPAGPFGRARAKPVAICQNRLRRILRYAFRLTQNDGHPLHVCARVLLARQTILIGLAMTLLCPTTLAQGNPTIDSVASFVTSSKLDCPPPCPSDTSLCIAFLFWGGEVYLPNPDTAMILWQQAHDIARRNVDAGINSELVRKRFWSFLGESLNNMAVLLQRKGRISEAEDNFHRSLEIADSIGDKSLARLSIGSLGVLYKKQGYVTIALTYYERSYKLSVELKDTSGIGYALNNLAVLYAGQNDYEQAIAYLNESLQIREEFDDPTGIANALLNLGGIYHLQNHWDDALVYYRKSLAISTELGDKVRIATCLNNMGVVYDKIGDPDTGMTYHLRGMKLRDEMGDKHGLAYSLDNIGVSYFEQGKYKEAEMHAKELMKLANELGDPDLINLGAKLSHNIAKVNGDYQKALVMYELHVQMQDSVNNDKTQKATIRQQTQHEFAKAQLIKEQEEKEAARILAEETSRRDNLQYSIILIAILTLFGGILMLGFINVTERMAEGIIFFSFLILFEFLLVLADPHIDGWSGGAPGIKLLFNAGIAAFIFPLHALFEKLLKRRIIKSNMQ